MADIYIKDPPLVASFAWRPDRTATSIYNKLRFYTTGSFPNVWMIKHTLNIDIIAIYKMVFIQQRTLVSGKSGFPQHRIILSQPWAKPKNGTLQRFWEVLMLSTPSDTKTKTHQYDTKLAVMDIPRGRDTEITWDCREIFFNCYWKGNSSWAWLKRNWQTVDPSLPTAIRSFV